MDLNGAPATCQKLETQGLVLLAFTNSTLVDVGIGRTGDFEENDGVQAPLGGGPRGERSGGKRRGYAGEKDNVRSRWRVRQGPRRDCGVGSGSMGGVTVAFSILEEVARTKGTLANGGGELMNNITMAAANDIAHVAVAAASTLVRKGARCIAEGTGG